MRREQIVRPADWKVGAHAATEATVAPLVAATPAPIQKADEISRNSAVAGSLGPESTSETEFNAELAPNSAEIEVAKFPVDAPSDSHSERLVPANQGGSGTTSVPSTEEVSGKCDGKPRKGDSTLLRGKQLITFKTAEQYLGIGERRRQEMVKEQLLTVVGEGQNRRITVESVLKCLPLENPS
jgi:hypothetical protein